MIIKKVKTTYPITLAEVKSHLRIDTNNFEDDNYIENAIIKSATKSCENFIDKDIALTTNTLTEYDFYGDGIRVNEGNFVSLTDISLNGTLITNYTVEVYDDHFEVDWDNYLGGDDNTLQMHFTTGYAENECPEEIKQATFITCGNLYDVERSSYTFSSSKKGDIVDRLLMPYKAIRW